MFYIHISVIIKIYNCYTFFICINDKIKVIKPNYSYYLLFDLRFNK